MVTQGDVARVAGVAPRTVSNVINDVPHVSDRVRARVLAAIDELGYRPNRAAQRLRTGRSRTIGVILPELDVGYFAEMARLIVEEAEAHGLTVLVTQTLGLRDRELEVLDKFRDQQPDGIILSPIGVSSTQLESYVHEIPIVLLGEQLELSPVDHISIDNVAATREMVQHLIDGGRTRIAFVGQSRTRELHMAELRLRGYREALTANGLPTDSSLEREVDGYHRADGARAVDELIAEGVAFDAVFGVNDLLALGAIRSLADAGLEVPRDVAVAGFDDVDDARYSIPRLTTVAPDKPAIARESVRRLLVRISGSDASSPTAVGYELVVRDSSGPVEAARSGSAAETADPPR